ncbi:TIGR03854 family LLM class F420-dependent oxidoreductase [Planotetraspora kaengkrachanensis]|uniref:LLM class F420-dependent oxidoreductase n=1 Tax=Planotetraspora kaengkrachanensis TaxID=575193 RepID=A0A8J3PW21_9ACTN|nr:TIGR03854 family LLM class F420-dependent oxidoreductase [Planotetraspora kaengkrachanensis]GIG82127.1 LLM class F420-dependent oxidoreductase [Planotetraspora kaengkrachanensis]
MKVRIGISATTRADRFAETVDLAESLGVDSLWLSELVLGSSVEPVVGMGYALARTTRLKVGTGVAILPGRHPVLVAKQLVSLAALAPRRVLPAFGLLPARPQERAFFPVPGESRGAVFDESMEVLRLLLRQERVTFKGEFHTIEDVGVGPLPARPLDIWLGGSGPRALRRVGRFGDGWLASFVTPEEAGAARASIQAHAAEAGREIEEDHFGVSLAVATAGVSDDLAAAVRRRRPDADFADFVPEGWQAARDLIERYVARGITKFVVRPAGPVPAMERFLHDFARELKPLET